MPLWNLAYSLDEGVRSRHRPMRQIVVQAVIVDRRRADQRKQCLYFRGEGEHAVGDIVVERQNAEPVAEQVGVAGPEIVYGIGELPVQALNPGRSILLVQ